MPAIVLAGFRANLVAQLAAGVGDTVQVIGHPVGEIEKPREVVSLERLASDFEWRSLGNTPSHFLRNRTETITATLRVTVYRNEPRNYAQADRGMARVEELLGQIVDAVAIDPSVGGSVAFCLVRRVSMDPQSQPQTGWLFAASIDVEAEHRPT